MRTQLIFTVAVAALGCQVADDGVFTASGVAAAGARHESPPGVGDPGSAGATSVSEGQGAAAGSFPSSAATFASSTSSGAGGVPGSGTGTDAGGSIGGGGAAGSGGAGGDMCHELCEVPGLGRCLTGTCIIDCAGVTPPLQCALQAVTCPPGIPCWVSVQDVAVDCGKAVSCYVYCDGCPGPVQCGGEECVVECAGGGESCSGGVKCHAVRCNLTCAAGTTCSGALFCDGTDLCEIHCLPLGSSCTGGVCCQAGGCSIVPGPVPSACP